MEEEARFEGIVVRNIKFTSCTKFTSCPQRTVALFEVARNKENNTVSKS